MHRPYDHNSAKRQACAASHLCRSDCCDIFLRKLLKDRCLASVVETEHEDPCLQRVRGASYNSCWPQRQYMRNFVIHTSPSLFLSFLSSDSRPWKAKGKDQMV